MVFQLAYGLETVVLRVFNVYGSRQGIGEYGGVIAQFVRRLLRSIDACNCSRPLYLEPNMRFSFWFLCLLLL